jgi:hypothetical protein
MGLSDLSLAVTSICQSGICDGSIVNRAGGMYERSHLSRNVGDFKIPKFLTSYCPAIEPQAFDICPILLT